MASAKYTRGKNGFFSTLVWDGNYNKDGTKHRKQLRSRKSSKDLEDKVNKFKEEVEKGKIIVTTDITFCEYASQWLNIFKAKQELNTRKMYQNIIEVHFKQLEGIKLSNIKRIHLQSVLNSVSDSTGRQVYLTFKQIIKNAVLDSYLPPNHVDYLFTNIQCPKPEKKPKRPLTQEEINAIKKANFSHMDKAYLYIIYGTGLRREEALALTKFDINFKRGLLSVNKALVFDGNNPCLKGTKSKNGVRKIPMPAYLTAYLREYVHDLPGSQLFYTANKTLMTKSSYDKMWKRIVTQINIAAGGDKDRMVVNGLTAHVFRHNYATNLCYQIPTVSIKHIAQLMGDTEKVVMDIYNHIILEKEDATSAVEKAVGDLFM